MTLVARVSALAQAIGADIKSIAAKLVPATAAQQGLMSAADKSRLDSLKPGSALIKETYYRNPGAISHTFAANAATYEVEVWSGGAGSGTGGGDGGSSSFGIISITGAKWRRPQEGKGGLPGIASGGLLNINGAVAGSIDASGWAGPGAAAPRGGSGGGPGMVDTGNDTTGFANGQQPGGGAGGLTGGMTYGSSGGYSLDRKTVVGGSTITGIVGVGGLAGSYGGKGGDGMIIVREFSSSVPGVETINQLIAQVAAMQPVVLSGVVGYIGTPGVAGPSAKIPFSSSFWSNKGGITYDSANRRFYLPSAGTYRVQVSGLNTGSTGNRVLVGLNNDAPTTANHKGVAYTNLNNQELGLESTFDVPAGSYIVFFLLSGALNNAADNVLGQFSIEKVG